MRKFGFLFASAALLFSLSCTQEAVSDIDGKAAPVVRLGDEIVPDALLVKFSASPVGAEMESLASDKGVTLRRVFPSVPGKEALEARYGLDRWYEAVVADGAGVEEKAVQLSRVKGVEVVELESVASRSSDAVVYPASAPGTRASDIAFNDPYLTYQWHYKNYGNASVSKTAVAGADVNVADVWATLCCGDPDIVVAVVDEGVKYNHPDLISNMWKNTGEVPGNGIDDDGNGYVDDIYGFNFVDNGPVTWDIGYYDGRGQWQGDSGHGTHCAGTIAAVNNNGKGVCGIAGGSGAGDGCRIMSCQIFSGSGKGGTAYTVARAIKYAADMGASVISCSFGYSSSFPSDEFYRKNYSLEIDAIHYFEASCNNTVLDGNIAIFAAGNDNHNYAHYPGAFADIISVSSFGPDYLPTYYTNYGPGCNIAAPGGEAYHMVNKWNSMVMSTIPSEVPGSGPNGEFNVTGMDYGFMQGTSMACPHVSGVVALGLSYAKKLGKTFSREEFKRMILASTKDIDQRIASKKQKTYAYAHGPLSLAPYYHQMGTGAIDAWRLMMHIEGLPTLTAQTGRQQWIDLTSTFGTSSVSLSYLAVDVPEATVASLGLQKISPAGTDKYPAVADEGGYAYVQFGRLYIYPTKIGSGKITISAVGGGDHLGGGTNPPGGMELVQTVSLMAREAEGGNGTGGWL